MPSDSTGRAASSASIIEQHFGRHTFAVEPPALLHVILRGDMPPAEVEVMVAFLHAHLAGAPFVLTLCALDGLGALAAESRKIMVREMPSFPFRAFAYYGGSFQKRLLIKLILGAAQLLAPNPDVPVRFFDTEAEARAWLAERERELAAR